MYILFNKSNNEIIDVYDSLKHIEKYLDLDSEYIINNIFLKNEDKKYYIINYRFYLDNLINKKINKKQFKIKNILYSNNIDYNRKMKYILQKLENGQVIAEKPVKNLRQLTTEMNIDYHQVRSLYLLEKKPSKKTLHPLMSYLHQNYKIIDNPKYNKPDINIEF